MIKKTITYTNFDGEKETKDFWFHLTKAELMRLEMSTKGGYAEKLQKIVDTKDAPALFEAYENLILTAYGVRDTETNGFKKSPAARAEFEQSEAYSELLMSLLSNEEEANAFMLGIMPSDLSADVSNHPALKK